MSSSFLDFTKFSIGADGVTPLYNTRHLILKDDMADSQGAFGAVSIWEVPDPPPPAWAAAVYDSDSDDDLDLNPVVVKVQTFDMKLPHAAYDYRMTKNALIKATTLTECDLVRFCFLETEVGDIKRIITIMERLTSSARKVAKSLYGTPEHREIAMKFAVFLEKLLTCLIVNDDVTFTDMKTNNVGYCWRDKEFRLIDLDSIDQGMFTFRYTEDFDPFVQTKYAFGVAMARFLLPHDNDLTAAFLESPLDIEKAASQFDKAYEVVQALMDTSPDSDRAALTSMRKLLIGAQVVLVGPPPPPPQPFARR